MDPAPGRNSDPAVTDLERTPLYELHRELGGRLVPFAGFEMPVQYSSILEEHAAVRERAGLFDVSHMGQIHVSGERAVADLERLLTCRVASLRPGRVRYGMLCNEAGGVVDDVTVYRVSDDELFLCVNAANIAKDREWITQHAATGSVRDESADTGLLALQGPAAPTVLERVASPEALAVERFCFARATIADVAAWVSNTGYTGSPGYEIFLPAAGTERVCRALLGAGADVGLVPAGLGARDTLRLEAALALYGHELDDTTSPLEAGLARFVKRRAGGFIGAEAIEARAAAGHERRLVGFALEGRRVARAEDVIVRDGTAVGRVTSGGPSPTLGHPIGLAYVPPDLAKPGTALTIEIRGKTIEGRVVETPFVRSGH